jgi:hypothetical protein
MTVAVPRRPDEDRAGALAGRGVAGPVVAPLVEDGDEEVEVVADASPEVVAVGWTGFVLAGVSGVSGAGVAPGSSSNIGGSDRAGSLRWMRWSYPTPRG